ncbi:hypothetical protein AVEN_258518-1 [Araneus ventricosus]|uniref:Uncharacterized protein n=1 Tax=Araneus ventricosus TaxID=182803 RepID=A0A4Y2CS56_ARAVE|nr:hypothetical protein AVEN_258518-1 [Araneus ventricosus]
MTRTRHEPAHLSPKFRATPAGGHLVIIKPLMGFEPESFHRIPSTSMLLGSCFLESLKEISADSIEGHHC